ncbi:RNA polymerase sigma-70 factor, ECF subfamily [Reichenbachiella faecimaris]|uniref:RNA polymerase sigma-70 factor, ECF subfamily n=1 Tax=Reichenbachiella faecimaris TaxID=692418 RepID=A0A1W2GMB2_REIFA|nr:sigma-70 family RNA polymerase sigma factor [Reichenbachiella faecimaris]SMD37704.1 RNA polymerase sigma-70 factor, ECF subfamily [Reichenbachiella faecimaris]
MEFLNEYQKKLFPYAYNILGSVDDALDAVQDVMSKFEAIAQKGFQNEIGYLIRSVVNTAINIKQRNQRLRHGVWLPEPISTDRADKNIEREEIIGYSMMVLLEHLNPKERAVFILKETFDYAHEEIADVLSITVNNSRKLLSRAKSTLQTHNLQRSPTEYSFNNSIDLQEYIDIIKVGDVKALESKLNKDIVLIADGGKNVSVVRQFTSGIENVIKLITHLYDTYHKNYSYKTGIVNHQSAILFYQRQLLVNCQVFEVNGDQITGIYSIVDPAKLKKLAATFPG